MNDRAKESQLLLGLLAILMLVISVVLFAQRIPPTNPDISKGQTESFGLQDSFILSYITHSPIVITSNAGFTAQGFLGSGTAEDPYVVEGYNITTTGTCISIQETDAYFVIRDCLLTGESSGHGIRLHSVTHGETRNNTINQKGYGVWLNFSSNNTVVNNTISGNSQYGVYLYRSSNNAVVNNTISGNYYGVELSSSSDNTLSSNIFVNNGICIYGEIVEYWRHTITTDNLVNGKILGYFWNWTSGTIDGTQYGQVILANCTGVTVKDGVFSNASEGIELGYSSYCSVMNNTLRGNYHSGVHLYSSSNSIVLNNTISGNDHGVSLYSSSDNNTVVNNTISGNDHGVSIVSSSNSTVLNNTMSGNDHGVSIAHSSNSTVMSNTISGNDYGVYLCYGSCNNVVVNNTISGSNCFGVYLYISWDNTLSSNIMVNNGIYISGNEVEYWRHNITTDNLVNGKQLGYFWNCTGGIIDGAQYGQVILANCTGIAVEDGVFSNASVGSLLGYSSYCNLTNNTLSGNYFGVSHYISSNNIVMNNTVSGNHYGVYLHSSSDNTVVNNTILENSDYGVYLWAGAEGNLIYLNVIAYNAYENAYDDNPGNHWNSTGMGNNWSDYGGTGVYHVPGPAGSIDYYPCMYPPDTTPPTIDHPADMDYEEATTGNFIQWNPSDTHPSHYVVSRNGTEVASAIWDWIFIIMDIDGLSVGVYNYTIAVYDTSGNCAKDTVFVTVVETIAPTIDQPADMDYEEGTTGNTITWTPSDEHPSYYVAYQNGTQVGSDSWDGNSITVNVDGLSVGIYNYTIVVYDTSGNCASDTVLVIVLSQTTTATTTTTTSTTITNGDVTGLVIVFLGVGAVGIIVVVLILMKYRRRSMIES